MFQGIIDEMFDQQILKTSSHPTSDLGVADSNPSSDLWHVIAKVWRVLIFSDNKPLMAIFPNSFYRERMVMGYYIVVNSRSLRLR